jgi:phosphoribosylamine---glycine ligase
MRILILGSGGREHALAWKLRQSPWVEELLVLPGNGGTGPLPEKFKKLSPLACALEVGADLTVVGPEALLAAGVVDEFQTRGLKIWGPNRAAAQIEASKAFAKSFMGRYGIPTAESGAFSDFQAAADYLESRAEHVVIKASGLAAGKGVILPESPQEGLQSLREIMLHKKFGAAGDQVVIEERLSGPEISVLAFCDGRNFSLMPPAQDHKRAFEHDTGPNTGGMGAYAPAPLCTPQLLAEIEQRVIQPALAGLLAEGCPYVGVLYAGLMLTEGGPKVLEFNCRLGDPETQVILPLLETDLLAIIEHSLAGTLSTLEVTWKSGSAATVVLASGGYPGEYETGKEISGLAEAGELEGVVVFHAGTRRAEAGRLLTAGGRVLNVTGIGPTLAEALARAYAGARQIKFEGMFYRTDIGAKASHDQPL